MKFIRLFEDFEHFVNHRTDKTNSFDDQSLSDFHLCGIFRIPILSPWDNDGFGTKSTFKPNSKMWEIEIELITACIKLT